MIHSDRSLKFVLCSGIRLFVSLRLFEIRVTTYYIIGETINNEISFVTGLITDRNHSLLIQQ